MLLEEHLHDLAIHEVRPPMNCKKIALLIKETYREIIPSTRAQVTEKNRMNSLPPSVDA